jgi:hypothetical protein
MICRNRHRCMQRCRRGAAGRSLANFSMICLARASLWRHAMTKQTILFVAFVNVFGCNKEEPKDAAKSSGPEKSSSSKAEAAKEVPKDACPAKYTKVADPGFCIKLPEGYVVGEKTGAPPEEIAVSFHKADDKYEGFTVRASSTEKLSTLTTYDDFTNTERREVKEKGELLGGKGRYFLSSEKGKSKDGGTMGVYVQGPKFLFICEAAGNMPVEHYKGDLATCKTITPIEG